MSMTQSTNIDSREEQSLDALFDCLASSDRGRPLGLLSYNPEAMVVEEIAGTLR